MFACFEERDATKAEVDADPEEDFEECRQFARRYEQALGTLLQPEGQLFEAKFAVVIAGYRIRAITQIHVDDRFNAALNSDFDQAADSE